MNETPAVIMNIQRQPGANIIQVVDRIKQLLPTLTSTLPKSIQVSILTDRTNTIRASVEDVQFELMLTVGLVVMVIFLFLRNLSATIIPSVAVPLSLVGTFGVMYLLGYSLNNLTLMALTISTGFVVDDAIVMIENIVRYIEEGETPMRAALRGAEQIGFTIISLTISLIAVLIPLLFMGDIVGRLFREFAVTLAVTILVSAVVSLTLTPMMCSRLLKHKPEAPQGRLYRASERGFEAVIALYGKMLRIVLRWQTVTLLVAVATIVVTGYQFYTIPKGFFPIQDTGVIQGVSEAGQTVSFSEMASLQQQLTKVILTDPAVDNLSSFIGIDGTNTTLNSGRILINLKPLAERKVSATEVIRRLQPPLSKVAGTTLFMQPVQDLTVEDRVSRTQFQYTLEDPSADELNTYAPKMLSRLRELPQLTDVATDQAVQGLRARLVFDRDTASRLGITPSAIDQTLYDAYGQREVSTIFTQLNQYHVVLEVKPEFRRNPTDLRNLFIRTAAGTNAAAAGLVAGGSSTTAVGQGPTNSSAASTVAANAASTTGSALGGGAIASSAVFPTGGQVPLSAFTRVESLAVPITVNHQGQFPVITLSFNLAPNVSLGDAVNAVNKVKDEIGLPPSIQAEFQGTAAGVSGVAGQRMGADSGRAGHRVYRARRALRKLHPSHHDSFHASLGGRRRACWRSSYRPGFQRDLADRHRPADRHREEERHHDDRFRAGRGTQGRQAARGGDLPGLPAALPPHHDDHDGGAARRACRWRSVRGTGSELRRPLGITMIGGLLISQMLTLFTTPVIYLFFDRLAGASRGESPGRGRSRDGPRRRLPAGVNSMNISAAIYSHGRSPPRCSRWPSRWPARSLSAFSRYRRCRRLIFPPSP